MRKPVNDITYDQLVASVTYDAQAGVFYRASSLGGVSIGSIAGGLHANGYVMMNVSKRKVLAHRMAWLWVYGYLPNAEIDHINGNKADNRISNLRIASRCENQMNVAITVANTSGIKGVCYNKLASKWQAYIQANNKRHYLGLFSSKENAAEAYRVAEKQLHGEFAANLRAGRKG